MSLELSNNNLLNNLIIINNLNNNNINNNNINNNNINNNNNLNNNIKNKNNYKNKNNKKLYKIDGLEIIYPKNINKYSGHIIKSSNKYKYKIKNKNKKNKYFEKTFEFDKKNNKLAIKAYNDVIKYKKEYSIKNNFIVNSYYKKDNYYIVNLTNNKKMLVDLEDLCLVEKYIWRIQNSNKLPTTKIKISDNIDDIKDYLLSKNKNYSFFKIVSGKFISFIRLKYGILARNITFKNNDRFDYRSSNILIGNSYNYFFINSKKINTKTKVDNLYIVKNNNNIDCWEVRAELNGQKIIRQFSFKEYGKIIGKNRAKEFTQKLINNNYTIL